ncbi:MAG: SH3 domain-containing protein [Lachnospiraceae bacterium]|nr:SH3 domain-containing protein [Lachnospiraceae bacterium]
MRRALFYLLFCLLLFSSFPVYAVQAEPLSGEAVITSNKLNVRSGPSKEYVVLGVLEKDDRVEVTGIVRPDWYMIDYNGEQGYIHGDYLVFTPLEETARSAEEATNAIPMKTYLILGLGIVILLVLGLLIYTAATLKRGDEEEEDEEGIPVTAHEDTNMHLGEVTYDTYRLDIDPSFFETTTLVAQPESINKEEAADTMGNHEVVENTSDIEEIDSKLEQASAQLAALQKEVEELKKQKQ